MQNQQDFFKYQLIICIICGFLTIIQQISLIQNRSMQPTMSKTRMRQRSVEQSKGVTDLQEQTLLLQYLLTSANQDANNLGKSLVTIHEFLKNSNEDLAKEYRSFTEHQMSSITMPQKSRALRSQSQGLILVDPNNTSTQRAISNRVQTKPSVEKIPIYSASDLIGKMDQINSRVIYIQDNEKRKVYQVRGNGVYVDGVYQKVKNLPKEIKVLFAERNNKHIKNKQDRSKQIAKVNRKLKPIRPISPPQQRTSSPLLQIPNFSVKTEYQKQEKEQIYQFSPLIRKKIKSTSNGMKPSEFSSSSKHQKTQREPKQQLNFRIEYTKHHLSSAECFEYYKTLLSRYPNSIITKSLQQGYRFFFRVSILVNSQATTVWQSDSSANLLSESNVEEFFRKLQEIVRNISQ